MASPIDVEAALAAHLTPLLGVPVATKVPNPRPDRHVRVTRTGGTPINLAATQVRVLVECWGPDEPAAFTLARDCSIALADTTLTRLDGHGVYGVDLDEPTNFEDPDALGRARYQFIAELTLAMDHTPAA